MTQMNVCETFTSIQGESSYVGLSCFFIRVSGCNLRCSYCDTKYAYSPGKDVEIEDLVSEARASGAAIVEITGGEPLLQKGFAELARRLRDETQKTILVETNGSCDISVVPDDVRVIMDVKCPESGAEESTDMDNIERLRPYDEVKFVLSSRKDYEWATAFVSDRLLTSSCSTVFFSPVSGILPAGDLADWIIRDGLGVRLQVQLHKILGLR